jgi:hypothetical protein
MTKKVIRSLFMKARISAIDSYYHSDRLRVTLFSGVDEDHYQLVGELVLTVGEYQNLFCAWSMGLSRMVQRPDNENNVYVPITVTVEGEMTALGRASELDGKPDVSVFPLVKEDESEPS